MHFATWTCNLTKRYLVDMQCFSECMLDMQLWNIKFQTCVLTSGHGGVVSCGHAYSFRTWSGNMWTCILLQDMQDKQWPTCNLRNSVNDRHAIWRCFFFFVASLVGNQRNRNCSIIPSCTSCERFLKLEQNEQKKIHSPGNRTGDHWSSLHRTTPVHHCCWKCYSPQNYILSKLWMV